APQGSGDPESPGALQAARSRCGRDPPSQPRSRRPGAPNRVRARPWPLLHWRERLARRSRRRRGTWLHRVAKRAARLARCSRGRAPAAGHAGLRLKSRMPPTPDFRDRVVLVTGVGRAGQIGTAVAHAFGRAGARLVVADLNAVGVVERAREFAAEGIEVSPCAGDLTLPDVASLAVEIALRHYDRLDVLV